MKFAKFIFILLALSSKIAISQNNQLVGKYYNGEDYVSITDSTLEFFTAYGCCILTDIYGFGSYDIINDKIKVNIAEKPNGKISSHRIVKNLNEQYKIEIAVNQAFVNIVLFDLNSKKIINAKQSDKSGNLNFEKIDNKNLANVKVKFSVLGFESYEIPLEKVIGKSIEVNLLPYEIIRNEIVFFEIDTTDKNIKIIGPIFQKTKKDKNHKRKVKLKSLIITLPWRWKFKDSHNPIPVEFVKQK